MAHSSDRRISPMLYAIGLRERSLDLSSAKTEFKVRTKPQDYNDITGMQRRMARKVSKVGNFATILILWQLAVVSERPFSGIRSYCKSRYQPASSFE